MEDLTCKQLQKMILFSCERIEKEKEEINKINVFPVPDQDTGTNLCGTLKGVKNSIQDKDFKNPRELADAILEGALMAAQGNTGIIYTGFMVGFFDEIKEDSTLNVDFLANAFTAGHKRAYESVQDPQKGTVLDVMDAFQETFNKKEGKKIILNFKKALESAEKALENTPNEMPLLQKAGVVDAGGLGFFMILETYLDVLQENNNPFDKKPIEKTNASKRFIQILTNRYEVVALMSEVSLSEKKMREKLRNLGDCLDIIQVKDKVKIHIHTDDPYDVRDIIKTFGNEDSMRIEDMAREIAGEDSVFKNKIGIVVDESSSLSEKIIKHYAIETIPYKIVWDGIDKLKGDNVPQKLKTAKENNFQQSPKIHEIDAEFFKEAFKRQLKRFNEVVCITSSNVYFKTFEVATTAKESFSQRDQEKIHIIDSKSISAGQAVLVLKAIDLIQEQHTGEVIKERLESYKLNIKEFGVTNSPYVRSKKSYDKIKKNVAKDKFTLIDVEEHFSPLDSLDEKNRVNKIFERIKKNFKEKKGIAVIIHGDDLETAKELKDKLKTINIQTSFINLAGSVVSLNIGYKGILVGYIKL